MRLPRFLAVAPLAFTVAAIAQNAPIRIFPSVDINNSIAGREAPYSYGTNTIALTCGDGSVSAYVVGPAEGNLFEDNLLNLKNLDFTGLTTVPGAGNGVNVCRGGDPSAPGNETATNCFQAAYEQDVGNYRGKDPDQQGTAFFSTYGIAPIDVSSYIQQNATQHLQFDLIDYGGFLGTSSLYLVTNCTQGGVVSGGTLTGNPIPSQNPTPDELKQTFPFDSTPGQVVQFTFDFNPSFNAGDLTIVDQTIPFLQDTLVTQSQFKTLVAGTSLATTDCIPLNGELDGSGTPQCKLFTITCNNSSTSTQTGTNCPQSTARNSLFSAKFDTDPAFIAALQPGTGFGFLMGSDSWTGSPCAFMPNTPDANLLCPQNVATQFLGDPTTGGGTKSLNSSFIGVRNVPLPTTAVTVNPMTSYGWTNSHSPSVQFVSTPATYTGGAPNGFIAAPIATLTYGLQDAGASLPDTTLPVPGDLTNTNSIPCPTTPMAGGGPFTSNAALGTLNDGQYHLHYFATDCAATEELVYTVQPSNPNNWASFKFTTINVDTVAPTVTSTPTPLVLNGPGNETFTCSDAGSGLAVCGTNSTQTLATVGLHTSSGNVTVPTTTPGSTAVNVYAKDLAGNTKTFTYTVSYSTGACLGDAGHQILQPINADGSSVFKQGRSVPAKFRVCDAHGNSIGTAGLVKNVSVVVTAGASQVSESDTGDTSSDTMFRWDPTGKQWIWNLSTSTLRAGYTYTYTVLLNDNSTIVFKFGLR